MNIPHPYHNDSAHKLLCDNRERYIAQSAQTRDGVVPRLPATHLHPQPGVCVSRERNKTT